MDENCEINLEALKRYEQNVKIQTVRELRIDNRYLYFLLHAISEKIRICLAVSDDHLKIIDRGQLDIDGIFMNFRAVHHQNRALRLGNRRFFQMDFLNGVACNDSVHRNIRNADERHFEIHALQHLQRDWANHGFCRLTDLAA